MSRPGDPDPRRQWLAIEYGLTDLWWLARSMRIIPVSQEMVLNHVAEHSLGLPKSY